MVEQVEAISHNIQIDEQGEAWVDGQIRLADVVLEHEGCHLTAQRIHEVHPTLTLGQIHAALAYYHDHRPELERVIGAQCAVAERVWAEGR